MKKFFLSVVMVIYMGVSSGIALDIHYCMGQREGITFFDTAGDKCGKCGMSEKNSSCCHDEHQFHKLEDDHKNVDKQHGFIPILPVYSQEFFAPNTILPNRAFIISPTYSPPLETAPHHYILYCVFRI